MIFSSGKPCCKQFSFVVPLLMFILVTTLSCKKTGNPVIPLTGNTAKLEIINVDTLCTSVYLKISKVGFTAPASILLSRDSTATKTFYLWGADTVVFQDSLLPGNNYTYRARVNDGQIVDDAILMVRTLDTTANNYSYQTWELGATNMHSLLNDVAVISDNDIWAVGEVYMADSLGRTIDTMYNALHWDGVEWKAVRIPTQSYGGYLGSFYINTICEFSPENIWTFSGANSYSHLTNGSWNTDILPLSTYIYELLGKSPTDIYGACIKGTVTHYNGTSWENEATGSTGTLRDIAGSANGEVLWASGYESDYSSTVLLKRLNNKWETIYEGTSWGQINGSFVKIFHSVWTDSPYKVYINNTGGIFMLGAYEKTNWKKIDTLNGVIYCMRGSNDNDIWIGGDYGLIRHYNGTSLQRYNQFYNREISYRAVSIKGNTVCFVGRKSYGFTTKMEIAVLRRN